MNKTSLSRWSSFVLAALVAGCSSSAPEKTGLLMWHVGSEEEAQIIAKLAAEKFTPESGVTVRCESIAWAEAHSKYLTALAGGVAPDLGTMGLTWGTEFGAKGQMVDLRKEFPADVDALKAQIFPSIWTPTEYRGANYAVPFDMTFQIIYYRKDLIPSPPKTWAELTTLLTKLNKEGKSMVIDWGSLDWIGYAPFLWQAGGDYYTPDQTASALSSTQAITGLEFFAKLYTQYKVPKAGQTIAQGLRSGGYPLGLSGNWLLNSLPVDAPELAGKWDVATLPAGPSGKHTAFIGGRSVGVFGASPMKAQAWAFIKFLNRPDVQKVVYEEIAKSHNIYMPPNVATWDLLPLTAGLKKTLLAQIKEAKAPPAVLGWNDSTRFVVEAIQKTIVEGASPAAVLAEAAAAMNERIEK